VRGLALLMAGLVFIGYAGSLFLQAVSREAPSRFVLSVVAVTALCGVGLIFYGWTLVKRRSFNTIREPLPRANGATISGKARQIGDPIT